MTRQLLPIYWPNSDQLSCREEEQFEAKAGHYWEEFYKQHQRSFFKDRHYLHREFPDLLDGAPTILEVGCGAGNTAYPLLEANPRAFVHACDFSATAVKCVQQHSSYASGRIQAFVADITNARLAAHLPTRSVDICTAVFVLSAISPAMMKLAVGNIAEVLKIGGKVYVRDYAAGDMAEDRFSSSSQLKCLGGRFFVRGDGTRAYYFQQEELEAIFRGCGFKCCYVRICERAIKNQALDITMERRWIQAVFQFEGDVCEASSSPSKGKGNLSVQCNDESPFGEWEDNQNRVDEGLSGLFGPASLELAEEEFEVPQAGKFRVKSLSRVHKHTLAHTGLMLWDAAPALAAYLAASPKLLNGKVVLELGCGSNPLCMLAALRNAARVVSSDGSRKALEQMAGNISLNSSKVIVERARLRQLAWGDSSHISKLQREFPDGFDFIVGADIVYAMEHVSSLFQTAHSLLKTSTEALLLLCHLTRGVSEDKILAAATAAGFWPAVVPPEGDMEKTRLGPIRLLAFAKICKPKKALASPSSNELPHLPLET